jgi:ankyrin repeat protein
LSALLAAGPPESPVADAAMRGDVAAIEALLRGGADVNAPQGDGMTALHWAAQRGDVGVAEMLYAAGADLEATTRIGGYTPLHVAAREGSEAMARSLLQAGADPAKRTTTTLATALHMAAGSGDAAIVAALLEHGADPNMTEGKWGQTPLVFAAAENRVEVIEVLLEHGADPNATTTVLDLQEQSELQRAAEDRRDAVLEAFTNDGARPATPDEIQAAVRAGRDIYRTGLPEPEEEEEGGDDRGRGRDPSITTKGGLTPLLHAARQGHLEAASALIEGGADVNLVSPGDGTSPLLMAAINGQFDMAILLLEHEADPNLASTLNGVAPLWAAVNSQWQPRTRYPQPQQRSLQKASYLDVMDALLEAGADPDARTTMHPWYMVYTGCGNGNCGLIDTEGSTAFLRAAYATDVAAMRLLIEHGADPNIPTSAPAPRDRQSDEAEAREDAREAIDEEFAEAPDSIRIKLLQGLRDGLPDSLQVPFTDEVLAVQLDSARVRLVAASLRADSLEAEKPDPSGLPPVEEGGPGVFAIHAASGVGYGEGFAGNAHRHVPNGWLPAIKFLVEEVGADINQRDHNGYNAVHHAAARGDNEMILYLVEHGADIMAVSRRGQTTVDMANGPVSRISPIPETVALLESLGAINNHNCVTCE